MGDESVLDDPRLYLPEARSIEETMIDLNEMERVRCCMLARKWERDWRKKEDFFVEGLPALWRSAHDQAIVDVAFAKKQKRLNGVVAWDETTWRSNGDGGNPEGTNR